MKLVLLLLCCCVVVGCKGSPIPPDVLEIANNYCEHSGGVKGLYTTDRHQFYLECNNGMSITFVSTTSWKEKSVEQ